MLHEIESSARRKQQARMLHMHQNGHERHFTVIGDILLHSGVPSKPIQIVVQSIQAFPSVTRDSISTPSVLSNLVKKTPIASAVPSELKNSLNPAVSPSQRAWRTIRSKRILRAHKVGWKLVQEFKTKIITLNSPEPERKTAMAESTLEQTYL